MNILDIYKEIKRSYKEYIGSFVSIKDERIRKEVSEAIKSEKLWPDALIQFNPNFASGIDVSQMIKNGFPIHKDLGLFFKNPFYKHQQEAIELGCQDKEFILCNKTKNWRKSCQYQFCETIPCPYSRTGFLIGLRTGHCGACSTPLLVQP